MRRDQRLVSLLLDEIGKLSGTKLTIVAWPDEDVRDRAAVEAIATTPQGERIAVEHTLIQPFLGEKEDTAPFMKVFGPLEKDPTLVL